MTDRDMIYQLKSLIDDRKDFLRGNDDFDDFFLADIEALQMAVERFTPRKPHITKRGIVRCARCKRKLHRPVEPVLLISGKTKKRKGDSHCPECGQAIDWSDGT